MNTKHLIIESVLAVAIVVLFILFFTGKKCEPAQPATYTASGETLQVAYINVDSLLLNYSFAQEANEQLMKKQEDARLKLNTRARSLQSEMTEFQRKLENNAFLSRERAEQEQQRLIKKQQDLQDYEAKLTEELMVEQSQLSKRLTDTVYNFLKEFNADQRYELIISNTANDNILYAKPIYDITSQVVDQLNNRAK